MHLLSGSPDANENLPPKTLDYQGYYGFNPS